MKKLKLFQLIRILYFRWKDITNVVNHKRNFGMECQDPADSTNYQLPDVETAKYIWRMCVHQVC